MPCWKLCIVLLIKGKDGISVYTQREILRMDMYFWDAGMSAFNEYKGLFAEHGKFDIPLTGNIELAFDTIKDFTIAVDVKQILYSGVKSISNPTDTIALPPAFPDGQGGFVPNPKQVPLDADNGSGFG